MVRALKTFLAVLLSFSIAASPAFATDGDNAAVAVNTKDGSSLFRFAFDVHHTMNEVIDETNIAIAYSSCEGCQTIAIAIQIVLVSSDPNSIVPENVAISINEECISCETMASAYQFVLGLGGPTMLDEEGREQIKEIRKAFYELAKEVEKEELTIAEIEAKVTTLIDRLKAVLRDHVVPADAPEGDGGGDAGQDGDAGSSEGGVDGEEVPQGDDGATPGPSVEPSAEPASSPDPSPSPSEEPAESPSPEESSPAPTDESPAPGPTASESP